MPISAEAAIGKGIGYPFTISGEKEGKAGVEESTGMDRIKESVLQILNTPIGSRVMRRDFGSRLHELPFEVLDETTVSLVNHFIVDALVKWEKRITVVGVLVSLDNQNNRLLIDINFALKATGQQASAQLDLIVGGA